MSINAVRINEWFNSNKFDSKKQTMRYLCKHKFLDCTVCGRKVTWMYGWCFHSLPYGGPSTAWCSETCLNK